MPGLLSDRAWYQALGFSLSVARPEAHPRRLCEDGGWVAVKTMRNAADPALPPKEGERMGHPIHASLPGGAVRPSGVGIRNCELHWLGGWRDFGLHPKRTQAAYAPPQPVAHTMFLWLA